MSAQVETAKRKRAEYQAQYRAANKLELKAKKAARYLLTREKVIASVMVWAEANRDKTRASVRKWGKANRAKCNALSSKYMKENPEKNSAKAARSRAVRIQATATWADNFLIKEMYHLAKLRTQMLGFRWHVDHIVPLKSKFVCGLHCEANLRVIPGAANLAKGNRFWPDMASQISTP